MKISEMEYQQEGVIQDIEDVHLPCVQRLMTLGLIEGSTIKYISSVSSSIEIEIYGSKLALRKDCASHFKVRTK